MSSGEKTPSEMNEYVLDVKVCIHLALTFAFAFSNIMEEGALRSEPKERVLHPLSTSTSST